MSGMPFRDSHLLLGTDTAVLGDDLRRSLIRCVLVEAIFDAIQPDRAQVSLGQLSFDPHAAGQGTLRVAALAPAVGSRPGAFGAVLGPTRSLPWQGRNPPA